MFWNNSSRTYSKKVLLSAAFLFCICVGGCAIAPKLLAKCNNDGKGPACYQLGRCFESGKCGLPRDAEQAQKAYRSACENFYEPGCARIDENVRDEAQNQALLVARAEKACKAGGATPCVMLGKYYERSDPQHSRTHYTQACQAGVSEACQHADRLARALCERQASGADCMAYGLSLWEGSNGTRNRGLAILFIRRGCDAGDKQACELLLRIQGE